MDKTAHFADLMIQGKYESAIAVLEEPLKQTIIKQQTIQNALDHCFGEHCKMFIVQLIFLMCKRGLDVTMMHYWIAKNISVFGSTVCCVLIDMIVRFGCKLVPINPPETYYTFPVFICTHPTALPFVEHVVQTHKVSLHIYAKNAYNSPWSGALLGEVYAKNAYNSPLSGALLGDGHLPRYEQCVPICDFLTSQGVDFGCFSLRIDMINWDNDNEWRVMTYLTLRSHDYYMDVTTVKYTDKKQTMLQFFESTPTERPYALLAQTLQDNMYKHKAVIQSWISPCMYRDACRLVESFLFES